MYGCTLVQETVLIINNDHKAQYGPMTAQKKDNFKGSAAKQRLIYLTYNLGFILENTTGCILKQSYVCAFAHHRIYKLYSFSYPLKSSIAREQGFKMRMEDKNV